VLAQASAPGSVLPFGAVVGLTVSGDGGVPQPPVVPVVVPSVLGRSPVAAAAVLAEAGLASEHRLRGAGGSGPVLDQEPAAGTRVGPGSLVTLVSQGERPAAGRSAVPAIVGLEVDAAQELLVAAGLVLRVDARPPDLAFDALGPILEQEPGAGVEVEAGSTVTAVVDALVAVPDLTGLDLDAAAQLLAALDLTLVVERESPVLVPSAFGGEHPADGAAGRPATTGPPGTERVTGQTPAPGTLVPAGSTIVVTVTQPQVGRRAAGPLPWWWLVVLVLVLAMVWSWLLVRGARHGRWVAAHVRASPHPAPAAVLVRSRPGAPPSLGVRVIPVPGPLDDVQVRQVDPE
jgi:beta-lactam-binding protein with PASTA domain